MVVAAARPGLLSLAGLESVPVLDSQHVAAELPPLAVRGPGAQQVADPASRPRANRAAHDKFKAVKKRLALAARALQTSQRAADSMAVYLKKTASNLGTTMNLSSGFPEWGATL